MNNTISCSNQKCKIKSTCYRHVHKDKYSNNHKFLPNRLTGLCEDYIEIDPKQK